MANNCIVPLARRLIAEMEGDNGCNFAVTPLQSQRLDALCVGLTMTDEQVDTLVAGEQNDMMALANQSPTLTVIHSLLNGIFDGELEC